MNKFVISTSSFDTDNNPHVQRLIQQGLQVVTNPHRRKLTEDEAIALANDTDFGLGSGIFTRDLARAHRVSKRLRAGICWINTYRAISPIAPFGGFNQSGYGREAGMDSILDYTRTRTTWINTSGEPMANPFVMR